jgi:hypothetical protein
MNGGENIKSASDIMLLEEPTGGGVGAIRPAAGSAHEPGCSSYI